ncbi:MAG: 50S ribosomal protein L4 [Candidatus Dadabacteria bacterium]|nr:50S ribosomal protein L4 [Candidatus Dadabacteria bacterium]NIQ15168.1 50S ribosomal protein L4 [Candidatus Dadabacteria bacterium]
MPKVDVYDIDKNKIEEIELKSEIFEAPVKEHLMHQVVNWQLASKRSGTASTKTRGEVRGGSSKPWKQKGLGRARHGSTRSPIWRKGGVTFGPKPKDWSFSLPKKVRKGALLSALSQRFSEESVVVLKDFNLSEIKTKQVAGFMKKFDLKKALIVVNDDNENLLKSARNIKDIKVIKDKGLNVYDILKFKNIVFVKDSVNQIQEAYV